MMSILWEITFTLEMKISNEEIRGKVRACLEWSFFSKSHKKIIHEKIDRARIG